MEGIERQSRREYLSNTTRSALAAIMVLFGAMTAKSEAGDNNTQKKNDGALLVEVGGQTQELSDEFMRVLKEMREKIQPIDTELSRVEQEMLTAAVKELDDMIAKRKATESQILALDKKLKGLGQNVSTLSELLAKAKEMQKVKENASAGLNDFNAQMEKNREAMLKMLEEMKSK